MKKFLITICMALIAFGLFSCNAIDSPKEDVDPNKDNPTVEPGPTEEELFEEELDRINDLIPEKFESNLLLPTSSDYTLVITADGAEIVDGYLVHQKLTYDLNISLTITLSKGDLIKTFYKNILMTYDRDEEVKLIEAELNNCIDTYLAQFPDVISDDLEMPNSSFEGITLEPKVTSSMSRGNNKYFYSFPKNRSTFIINVTATKQGISVKKSLTIPILSAEEVNKVPRIYIDTKNEPIVSKDDYIQATLSLQEKDDSGKWKDTITNAELKIRGRGNSTWGMPKKPYKLKFESKISFFGEKKNKTWTLIANHLDQSLMRNYLAYYLGRSLDGLDFTTSAHYVDVYLNDEYIGNYLLCEQMEVKTGRVEIEESDELDTGYLIELDNKFFESNTGTEGKEYFVINVKDRDNIFALHTPDPEEADNIEAQVTYIKQYFIDTFACLKARGKVSDYIDLDSAVDCFIVEELFKNKDVGHSSFYLYKDKGSKLFFGPLWDFDLSSMAQGNLDASTRGPEGWYSSLNWVNPFFYYLMDNSEFKTKLKARWNEIKNVQIKAMVQEISNVEKYIHYSAEQNFKKWDVIGKEREWWTSDEVYNAKTYAEQVMLLKTYFNDRFKWLDSAINKL